MRFTLCTRPARFVFSSLAALAVAACGGSDDSPSGAAGAPATGSGGSGNAQSTGGSAGAPSAGGSSTAGSPGTGTGECVETPNDVAFNEQTPLGFAAAELIDRVGGTYATSIVWRSGALYATHARSRTTTALALDFDSAVAVARFVDSRGGGCVGGDGPCFVCQGRLEVDLVLRLSTEDGALDETLPITLLTGTVETASFTAELDAADVVGAYFEAITPNAGYTISGLRVEANYSAPFSGAMTHVPDQWNGFVAAVLTEGSSSGVLQAHGYFPPETAGANP